MKTTAFKPVGLVTMGPLKFSHNQFLVLLLGLTGIACSLSGMLGASPDIPPGNLWGLVISPQMIWAYVMLPIAVLAFARFRAAGYGATAWSCALIAGAFLIGAAMRTFLS